MRRVLMAVVVLIGLAGLGVGCGESTEMVEVPDVVGMGVDEAFTVICDAGLTSTIGAIATGDASVKAGELGDVVTVVSATDPAAGEQVELGSAISVDLFTDADVAVVVDESVARCESIQ